MDLRTTKVEKDRNIMSFIDKGTKKMVWADLATGLVYGLNKKPVKRLPVIMNTAIKESYEIRTPDADIVVRKIMNYIRTIYSNQAGLEQDDFNDLCRLAIPTYEKVAVLGLTFSTTMYEHIAEIALIKLTKELVEWLQANVGGEINSNNLGRYNSEKKYIGKVKEIMKVYPEPLKERVQDYLKQMFSRGYDEAYTDWIVQCLVRGKLGAMRDWAFHVNTLYETVKISEFPLNYDWDFFRNYIPALIDNATKEDEISRKRLALVNNPKYLCDLSEYGLVMRFPTCKADFVAEGKGNANCVSGYYANVIEGSAIIVFIRKIDKPDESYITCELHTNRAQILQFKTKYNEPMRDKERLAFDKLDSHLQRLYRK